MRAMISASPAGVPATTVRPSTTRSDFSQMLIHRTMVGRARASALLTSESTGAGQRDEFGVIASLRVVVICPLATPHPKPEPWTVALPAASPAALRPGQRLQ